MNRVRTLEEMPLNKFHYQMFFYTGGGAFIDGYIIGIIAVALSILQPQFHLSLVEASILGIASLVGMFFGGLGGGLLNRSNRPKKDVHFGLVHLCDCICSPVFCDWPDTAHHFTLYFRRSGWG